MRPELIGEDWYELLKDEFEKPYFKELWEFLSKEYRAITVRPKATEIFNAFKLCRLADCKVVIIGQDPYPTSQAHGLAFSSLASSVPASLRYIFKELDTDLYQTVDVHEFKQLFPNSNLTPWAKQGVLLLNAVLTVRDGLSNSHKGKGWEIFTKEVVRRLVLSDKRIVFLLWGNDAKALYAGANAGNDNQLVLTTGHPASGTHGKDLFSGCSHFSLTNKYLEEQKLKPIVWSLNA
jgi:uracil-DNA glycosylase